MLYLLRRKDPYTNYDRVSGGIVRAKSPRAARKLMHDIEMDLAVRHHWLQASRSTCTKLKEEGPEETILLDVWEG